MQRYARRIVAVLAVLALCGVGLTAGSAAGQDANDPTRGIAPDDTPPPPSGDFGLDDRDPGQGGGALDQLILDDLIVDGSTCVGLDCNNGESFSFDTIRLKENNLRIHFQDTSTSASFPSTDWRIVINDSSNGGANRFSIEDASASRTPFTIEGSAPNDALYVDDGGRVGFGTDTPVTDLHIQSGNTPTVRLAQDGSSGFSQQTWDMAGNEANFFIRDATNGSTLPFRIYPGSPSNALTIEASGDIGMGTTSPASELHIVSGATSAKVTVQSTLSVWEYVNRSADGDFAFNRATDGADFAGAEFIFSQEGGITLQASSSTDHSGRTTGTIYFDGDTFCGHDGTAWRPLHAAGNQTCS